MEWRERRIGSLMTLIFSMRMARRAAAYVTQKENFALPIKTYAELGIDSFESIVGRLRKDQ